MLNLYQSNRLERLLEALADQLSSSRAPMGMEWIAVRGSGMRGWLTSRLATRFGIWAGGRPMFPRDLVQRLLALVLPGDEAGMRLFDRSNLTWSVLAALPGFTSDDRFAPLHGYLSGDSKGVKAYQLASRIAQVYDEYCLYRPDMVLGWEDGAGDGWQPVLWREISTRLGGRHPARVHRRFLDEMKANRGKITDLPEDIYLFGMSTLPPAHVEMLASLPERIRVNLFVLTPTREYWADLRSRDAGADRDFTGHSLLALCGRLGREFQEVLLDADHRISHRAEPFIDSCGAGDMLSMVQSDMLTLTDRRRGSGPASSVASLVPLDRADRSIVVSSCHGPMREVEVLKDQILDLLNDRELDLLPRDVLVLAPDMETYAPLVEAVFVGEEIPFRVNLGMTPDRSLFEALGAVLSAARGRATLQEVFDILIMDPVRERFGMSLDEVDAARDWMLEAGVRWGIDSEHRRSVGQPDVYQNTWRFGLDRIVLGYAMTTDGGELYHDVLPYDVVEGAQAHTMGKLAEFATRLFDRFRSLTVRRTMEGWRDEILGLASDLFALDAARELQMQLLREGLSRLVRGANDAGLEELIDLDVVRAAIDETIDEGKEAPFGGNGGVTFSNLLPMGGIPARVICLLGMNDGAFPRMRRLPGFDLTATSPRPGDRSVRNDDLYLFLESILAARERLIISYVGQCDRTNKIFGPSVVVDELLDLLDNTFDSGGSPGGTRDMIVTRHPLQGFSPSYFDGTSPALFSYSSVDARRSLAMRSNRGADPAIERPFLPSKLPGRAAITAVRVEDLLSFFRLPARDFVRRRMGIGGPPRPADIDPREPLEMDSLDEHLLGQEMLELAIGGGDLEGGLERFRAAGSLPHGSAGEFVYGRMLRKVAPIVSEIRSRAGVFFPAPLTVDLEIEAKDGPMRIVGGLRGMGERARVMYRFSKVRAAHWLELWVGHLLLNSSAPSRVPKTSFWVGHGGGVESNPEVFGFDPLDSPETILSPLLDLYVRGQSEPLRMVPDPSMACAEFLRNRPQDIEAALEAARRALVRSHDASDPALELAWRGIDPIEDPPLSEGGSFDRVAIEIFGPLIDHRREVE